MTDVQSVLLKQEYKVATALLSTRSVDGRIGLATTRTYHQQSYEALTAVFAYYGLQTIYHNVSNTEEFEIVVNNTTDVYPLNLEADICRMYESNKWVVQDSDLDFYEDTKVFSRELKGAKILYAAKLPTIDPAHSINHKTMIAMMSNSSLREFLAILQKMMWASAKHKNAYIYIQSALMKRGDNE